MFFAATSEGWSATEVRLVVGCVVSSFGQVSLCCDFSLIDIMILSAFRVQSCPPHTVHDSQGF